MRLWIVPVRITNTRRCPEGFYVLVNGSRLRFATRKLAIEAVDAVLLLNRIQIVTVREYAARKKHRAKVPPPP